MTDTITMPREVAKRILRNIEIGNKLSAGIEMRREIEAALEQPQDHHEQHLDMVPAGWKLVPVEPTRDMLTTWIKAPVVSNTTAPGLYRAMLAAAPQPPVVEQPQGEQEPAPNGATHRQPKQGAFYKRVDGKWYVWSRMENGEPHRWYISPGTSESCLEPLNAAAPQPPAAEKSSGDEQPQSVTDCHQSQPQVEQESVAHSIVAGALFDFMGWLTSCDDRLVLSSTDDAVPAVEVITAFAKMRGLSLDEAMVRSWQDSLMQQPKREPLTDEQINEAYGAARVYYNHVHHEDVVRIARAIDLAHKIGGES